MPATRSERFTTPVISFPTECMMNQVNRLFLLVGLLLPAAVKSQTGFGPEAGLGMSSMKFAPPLAPIHYTAADLHPIASGKSGAVVDIPMDIHLFFQSGVSFSRKGAVRDFSYYRNDSFNEKVHQELHMAYFDVPVGAVFKTGVQGKGRLFAGLGATLSYLLGGNDHLSDHQVYNDTLTNTNDVFKITPGKTFKAFDIGVTLSAGYELATGLFFRLYYTAGVSDLSVNSEIDKNRIWGISAGYFFGKGRNINKEADDLIDHSILPSQP